MDNIVSKHWAFRPSTGHLNMKLKQSQLELQQLLALTVIHNFLRLLAVRFSTSCSHIFNFLGLDFQLLVFRMFLRVIRKNKTFLLLAAACVFLRREKFLRHFCACIIFGLYCKPFLAFWLFFPLFRLLIFTELAHSFLIIIFPCISKLVKVAH